MLIYKIFRAGEWQALEAKGETSGAPIDLADGYIHFSTGVQVAETAARYFAGVEGLVLVACEADAMGSDLKWEPSRGSALFPHLFRKMTLSDVLWTKPLPWDGEAHIFPENLA